MEQNISESTNLNLYRALKDISAIVFHDIKFSGNIFLLDKDYDEKKEYETTEIAEISDAWYKLYDEYFEVSNSTSLRKDLRNKDNNLKLLITIKAIEDIVKILNEIAENVAYVPNEAYIKILSSIGNDLRRIHKNIRFDITRPLNEQINSINSVLGGLKTKYELSFKDDLVVNEDTKNHYYEIKANIESILDKDYIPDHINMLQWLAYENQYKQRIRSLKSKKNGSK